MVLSRAFTGARAPLPPMQFSPPPDADSLPNRLPPLNHHGNDRVLPSLSSVTGIHALRGDPLRDQQNHHSLQQLPPMNGPFAYRQYSGSIGPRADSPATMDFDGSNSVTSAPSPDRHSSTNSLTLDDPDVRLAAEALGDLRAGMAPLPCLAVVSSCFRLYLHFLSLQNVHLLIFT